ncbi:N-acetyltransferase GCN5 [Paenibacillus sp. FSL R7-277]|uniref:GNAT family N-acetyltransferase n=1 Tax=Paenibacillus sp. FSL R7-277 TaxID=1227352 RepID=UPI0003E249FD|nr:GNAT family N-acetyltransferase [Paenibacillus sp. FSL R7-277]ETT58540.1 N-acetyltransferase GCN5 [Paenibacillus sp. FSL R7-277]
MKPIVIQPVNAQNWEEALEISVCKEHRHFVPSVMESLAYAYIKPWDEALDPYILSIDGEIIGFFYLSFTPGSSDNYWIGGFQIDHRHQRKGYGKQAMIEIIKFIREVHPKCSLISLTVEQENSVAQKLYEGLGFTSEQRLNQDGEIIYTIQLD